MSNLKNTSPGIPRKWNRSDIDSSARISGRPVPSRRFRESVIRLVFEAAGLTVSGKKTETMLLRTLNQVLRTSPLVVEAEGQRYIHADDTVFVPGHHTWDQTTDPTRVGMLRPFQARAVRYGGCLVHVKVAPTIDRGDGDPYCTGVWLGLSAWSTSVNSERHTTTST